MPSKLERLCIERGMKMTGQRKVIAQVVSEASESHEHPDVEEVHRRAARIDAKISIATVYRTMRLFDEAGIVEKHDFRDGRARYEEIAENHHDHLIDLKSGRVVEFFNEDIETLQRKVANELGYELVDHRLELYAVPADKK